MATCAVSECGTHARSRGLCNLHYRRLLRLGSTELPGPEPFADRFWARVDRSAGTDACWPWLRGVDPKGYGRIKVGSRTDGTRRSTRAHRVAYELANGPIPSGLQVDHRCRNPRCVNPAHLQAVTNQQNAENRGPKPTNSSGIRGVSRNGSGWRAQATHHGVRHYSGTFRTLAEAEAAAVALRNRLMTNNLADRQEAS